MKITPLLLSERRAVAAAAKSLEIDCKTGRPLLPPLGSSGLSTTPVETTNSGGGSGPDIIACINLYTNATVSCGSMQNTGEACGYLSTMGFDCTNCHNCPASGWIMGSGYIGVCSIPDPETQAPFPNCSSPNPEWTACGLPFPPTDSVTRIACGIEQPRTGRRLLEDDGVELDDPTPTLYDSDGGFVCSGTLIHSHYVLTSAECAKLAQSVVVSCE